MIKMKSLKRHPWDGSFKAKGDEFHAVDEREARTAIALGWAERAQEEKPAKAEKVEKSEDKSVAGEQPLKTETTKRKYTRRDMTAE